MQRPRDLHPLLLEPKFWRDRLELGSAQGHSLAMVPRPDLSSSVVEVEEFSFRAHDGVRLWGLLGRCALNRSCEPARIRLVGPCEPPRIDFEAVGGGTCEFLLQEKAGRRLQDRVLDVIQLFRIVRSFQGIDGEQVKLHVPDEGKAPDELLIASELQTAGLAR